MPHKTLWSSLVTIALLYIATGCAPPERIRSSTIKMPTTERSAIEAHIRDGHPVAVNVDGDEFEIIEGCLPDDFQYAYTAVETKTEVKTIKSLGDLEAIAPVGEVMTLEGKVNNQQSLQLEWRVVGIHRLRGMPDDLQRQEGPCAEVTHIISAAYHGAFTLTEGNRQAAQGKINTPVGDGSGSIESQEDTLISDGDFGSCLENRLRSSAPPRGCGSIVEVELSSVKFKEPVEVSEEEKLQEEPKRGYSPWLGKRKVQEQGYTSITEEVSQPEDDYSLAINAGIYNSGIGLSLGWMFAPGHELGTGVSGWIHFSTATIEGDPLFAAQPEIDFSYRYYWDGLTKGPFAGIHLGSGWYQIEATLEEPNTVIAVGRFSSARFNVGYRLQANSFIATTRIGYAAFAYLEAEVDDREGAQAIFDASGPLRNEGSLDLELSLGWTF